MIEVIDTELPDNCYQVTVGSQTEYISTLFLSDKEERTLMSYPNKNQLQEVLESYMEELDKQKQHIHSLITRL